MNGSGTTTPNVTLMTLLAGATLGGVAVAITTTKIGKELQNRLIALGGRFNTNAGRSDLTDDEIVRAAFI